MPNSNRRRCCGRRRPATSRQFRYRDRGGFGAALPAPSRVFAVVRLRRGSLVGSLVDNGRGQGVQIAWPLRRASHHPTGQTDPLPAVQQTKGRQVRVSGSGSIGTLLTVFYLQARNWAIGSDPGLLRLRMASRTTAALAVCAVDSVPADQGHRAAADGRAAGRADHDDLGAIGERARSASTQNQHGAAAGARRAGHHRCRGSGAAPGGRGCRVRAGGVRRGLRAPVRPARNRAGDGHLHGLLLHAVSAGQVLRAAVADRRHSGWHHVQLCVGRLPAARSAGKRTARKHSGTAGADDDRRGYHRRDRAGRPAR